MSQPGREPAAIDVTVNVEGDADVPTELVERAVRLTVADSGEVQGEVSVTFVPDDAIQTLNREYLDRDRVTDVIAFTLGSEGVVLGDVYVGHEQAVRQAAEMDVEARTELVRLAIHGTLHVLGHDHPEGEERVSSPMFELQERLVRTVLEGG